MTGMIKRMLATLVAAGMMLVSLTALAGTGDRTIYRRGTDGDSVRAVAYIDSTVYVFTWGSDYYTWSADAGELTEYPFDNSQFQRVDGGYTDIQAMVSSADGAYAIVVANDPTDDGGIEISSVTFCPVEFAADGTATVGEGVDLDWDDMICEDGDYASSDEICFPFLSGNRLTFTTYPDGDEASFFVYDTGMGEYEKYDLTLESDNVSLMGYCAYGDGTGLIAAQDGNAVALYTLDLETGAFAEAGAVSVGEGQSPGNFLYDADAEKLYYTMDGQLYHTAGLDGATAEAVAAAPIDDWGDQTSILTGDGAILLADYSSVVLRSTDPAARAEKSITVFSQYNSALENAYDSFTAKYPDTDVVISTEYPDITDAMLTQSSAIDIYVTNVLDDDFGALYNRGYLADLSGSEALTAAVGEMYPDIQASVTKDGALVALPVDLYVSGLISYDPVALEKLGLTQDDVPTTWAEFFRLLQRLPDLIGDTGVTACDPSYTQSSFRGGLFYMLFQSYLLYLEKTPEAGMAFDTELFQGLIAEFEKIDFSGLGLPESDDDMEAAGANSILFETYAYLSSDQVGADGMTPLLLSLGEGIDPMMEADLTVAFVNPYSQNPERAIQYLEEASENLDGVFLVNACPDKNDPIPNGKYDETMAYYDSQIAAIQAELAKADEADAADWQEQLDQWQAGYDDFKETGAWDVSTASIAAYRLYAQYMKVFTYFGISDDDSSNLYEPVRQYLDGAIDAGTMLKNIDQKLQMMLMEGT